MSIGERLDRCPIRLKRLKGAREMIIGERLRVLREVKSFSQGEIEKRTGLLRCYISRVENGHTVPSIETLEKLAIALEIPLYQLFYDGQEPPDIPISYKRRSGEGNLWGNSGKETRYLSRLRQQLGKMKESDRRLLLLLGQKMSAKRTQRAKS
jgi:transcriptional regulator with XRE-family HTH domain